MLQNEKVFDKKYYSNLESTGWIQQISNMLQKSCDIVESLKVSISKVKLLIKLFFK